MTPVVALGNMTRREAIRTLYQRYKTQYDHQVWTCEYLGLRSIEPNHWAALEAWMRQDAAES